MKRMERKHPVEYSKGTLLVGYRLMWWAPWGLTSPFMPRVWRGGDEYDNPSICLTLPCLGAFIFFYSRHLCNTVVPDDSAGSGKATPFRHRLS